MNDIQLPRFQPHPECAAGLITIDDAIAMLECGWLTIEGACYILPPQSWVLFPQPIPANIEVPEAILRRRRQP
jgi:hypothetical protein